MYFKARGSAIFGGFLNANDCFNLKSNLFENAVSSLAGQDGTISKHDNVEVTLTIIIPFDVTSNQ